jgi:hypothetical protein
MKRRPVAIGAALASAFVFGGCADIVGVGSLSGGGPDASVASVAGTGGRGSGGASEAFAGSGGASTEQAGAGGASARELLDSGASAAGGAASDGRALKRTPDAGRKQPGGEGSGGAPPDAATDSGICVPGQSERWIPWSGVTAPDDAYVLSSEPVDATNPKAGELTYYICRARDTAGNVIPGTFEGDEGCFYTPDGTTQLQAMNFDVLADPLNCFTYAAYSGRIPAKALKAGNLGQIPLYICAATPSDAPDGVFVAGYIEDVPNATCRVPYGDYAYDIPTDLWILDVY